MVIAITVIIILTIGLGSLYLQSWIATKTKQGMGCIRVADDKLSSQVRSTLVDKEIFFSDLLWAPARATSEIWIKIEDIEKARSVLAQEFKLESKETTTVVLKKISL